MRLTQTVTLYVYDTQHAQTYTVALYLSTSPIEQHTIHITAYCLHWCSLSTDTVYDGNTWHICRPVFKSTSWLWQQKKYQTLSTYSSIHSFISFHCIHTFITLKQLIHNIHKHSHITNKEKACDITQQFSDRPVCTALVYSRQVGSSHYIHYITQQFSDRPVCTALVYSRYVGSSHYIHYITQQFSDRPVCTALVYSR